MSITVKCLRCDNCGDLVSYNLNHMHLHFNCNDNKIKKDFCSVECLQKWIYKETELPKDILKRFVLPEKDG